jgi:mannan endo-1,4-beta-mannosidase
MAKVTNFLLLVSIWGCGSHAPWVPSQTENGSGASSLESADAQRRTHLVVDRYQRTIIDLKGQALSLRGIQVPLGFRTTQKSSSDPEVLRKISDYGFNMVRVTWGSVWDQDYDIRFEVLENFLKQASTHNLIVMLEAHNVTGKNTGLVQVVDYWAGLYQRLKPYEHFLMLNIANEWGGNDLPKAEFRARYEEAIKKLRDVGYRIPLIVDVGGWGQDLSYLTEGSFWWNLLEKDQANMGFANLMFGVHLYGDWSLNRGDQGARFGLREDFIPLSYNAPLFIGEFGWNKPGNPDKSKLSLHDFVNSIKDHRLHVNVYSWGGNNPSYKASDSDTAKNFSYLDFVSSDYTYGQSFRGAPQVVEYRFKNSELTDFGKQMINNGRLVIADRKAEIQKK